MLSATLPLNKKKIRDRVGQLSSHIGTLWSTFFEWKKHIIFPFLVPKMCNDLVVEIVIALRFMTMSLVTSLFPKAFSRVLMRFLCSGFNRLDKAKYIRFLLVVCVVESPLLLIFRICSFCFANDLREQCHTFRVSVKKWLMNTRRWEAHCLMSPAFSHSSTECGSVIVLRTYNPIFSYANKVLLACGGRGGGRQI